MKTKLIAAALFFCATAAQAERVGVIEKELADSNVMTVSLLDTPTTHPYCHGEKEALAEMWDPTAAMRFQYARGCWHTIDRNNVAVEMWKYADGDSVTLEVNRADFSALSQLDKVLGPEPTDTGEKPAAVQAKEQNKELVRAVDEAPAALADAQVDTECQIFQMLKSKAHTEAEKAFVKRVEKEYFFPFPNRVEQAGRCEEAKAGMEKFLAGIDGLTAEQ